MIPFDLSRGGSLFSTAQPTTSTSTESTYRTRLRWAIFVADVGLRGDTYYGLTSDGQAEPRIGLTYNIKKTNTVLRASFFENDGNPVQRKSSPVECVRVDERRIAAAVFRASSTPAISTGPSQPVQRRIPTSDRQIYFGGWGLFYWKFTRNAYDFSALQNTTITFPIAWNKSKLDGATGRVSTTNIHGFNAYWTSGHTRARFFPPQSGGLLNTSQVPDGVFRIDHDQAFQSNAVARYQRPNNAEYIEVTWRYDSGMVVSGVPDVLAALGLTPAQQVDIGLSCNGVAATLTNPFTPSSTCAVGKSTQTHPAANWNGERRSQSRSRNAA